MQYYYGEKNIQRALDEAAFWKHQEKEHAGLIPEVTPGLEPQYTQELEQFGVALGHMNAQAVKYIASITRSKGRVPRELRIQMLDFIKQCVEQSQDFTALMTKMLSESQAVHGHQPSQVVINHMIRESQYFIGIDQLILSSSLSD